MAEDCVRIALDDVVTGMRLGFVLLAAALLLLIWSLFTVVKAWNVPAWMLAIAAGEWGHYAAVVALALAVVAARADGHGGGRWVTMAAAIVAVVAAGILLQPLWGAWRESRELPNRMQKAFPGAEGVEFGLDWRRVWFPAKTDPVPVESHVFAYAGTADALALDFYRPRAVAPVPCVIAIHGGGWDGGDRGQFADSHHALAREGYAVAAISYRLAPQHRWPAQREDTLAALRWLQAHAAELGIDPMQIVLLGRSAGGQIATAVGYGAGDPAIRGVVAFYAPHDLHFVWSIAREDDVLKTANLTRQFLGGAPDNPERVARYDSASGELMVEQGRTPPTLLIHGTRDSLVWVEHSRRLSARLAEAQVPVLFIELPWATHASDYYRHGPAGQFSEQAVTAFVRAVTEHRAVGR
jgi:acetyl esterase/lipase